MRILIVEDEHKIAQSLKKGLEQEGFVVDMAFDGQEGYDLAATSDYDSIVLDLMLPGMDGIEICQTLRSQGIHTPILMLTARGELDDRISGLNKGADDYLTKPFAFTELLARLRALLRRPKQTTPETLRVSDLELNPTRLEVKREGKKIKLSRKEFALLEYLMRHKGTTITKDQLMEHVWNYESDILPNTVEVYIGYLRSKIDKPFPKKIMLIHTVRGFGYTISE